MLRYSERKNASTLRGKSAADVCRSEWFEDLTSLRSQDPAVANSVRGRELWRLKLRSKSTWEFADGGWLVAWYNDLAGGVH